MRTHMAADANSAIYQLELSRMEGYELADHLEDAIKLRAAIEYVIRSLVKQAREDGYSWQWVADELGMSRQAAWEKYRNPSNADDYTPPRSDDPELPLG